MLKNTKHKKRKSTKKKRKNAISDIQLKKVKIYLKKAVKTIHK